jgi:hypothetical protein
MQQALSSALIGAIPDKPEDKSAQRRELREDDLDLSINVSMMGTYQLFLVEEDLVQTLEEALGPWLRGAATLTVDKIEDTKNKPEIVLEVERKGLVQLAGVEGRAVDLQDLAPLSAALGQYRHSVGTIWPGFMSARIVLKVSFPPYGCTFQDNRMASGKGEVLHACVEMNGQEFCGVPEEASARFSAEAVEGLEVCIGGR